jgi:multiple sugar transport system permease protein
MNSATALAPVGAAISTRRSRRLRRNLQGYLFISPWLLGFFIWVLGPMVASLIISLTEWDILTPAKFVGLTNYARMLGIGRKPGEPQVYFDVALLNTAYITLIGVPLQVIAALLLAQLLNYRGHGVNLFRTIYYLPVITPAVASALIWIWIFNPEFGLANVVLRALSLPEQTWFRDPTLSKPLFILMGLWSIGGRMVIFLGGLQSVPDSLYDAAKVDGAGAIRRFLSVTLPMISPTIFFVICTSIIESFQTFTGAFIITGGGPVRSTLFYVLYIYRNAFEYLRMGFGCALAWVLFVIILAVTLAQFWLGKRWVYYEVL